MARSSSTNTSAEPCLPIAASQSGPHRVEDRRLEQELVLLLVEGVQNDLGQVVDDVTAGAAKVFDETGPIIGLRERHRRQVNADRPAFSALMQHAQALSREAEVQDLVEEGR